MASRAQQINKFFSKFHNYGTSLMCYSLDNTNVSRMKTTNNLSDLILKNNQGADAYFYVNSGGTKKNQIRHINACFVDIDAGKDKNGKYLTTAQVAKKKQKMRDKISKFKPSPNIIVETRNGYHLYWLVNHQATPANIKLWETIQAKLHNSFHDIGSDNKVGKLNQIMRVPFTKWQKKWANKKEVFEVKCNYIYNGKYELSYLNNELSNVSFQKKKSNNNSYQKPSPVITSGEYTNSLDTSSKSVDVKTGIVLETIDFLTEISTQLKFKGLTFSSKSALRLANELHKLL